MSKILVLGSEGFIGRNLIKHLNLITKYQIYRLSLSLGHDLRRQNLIEDFLKKKKINIIINLAGHTGGIHYFKKNYDNVYLDNYLININIINYLKNVKKKITIINILPNCLYNADLYVQDEKKILVGNPHESVECYANPKRILLTFTNKLKKTTFINLVFGGVFGPGDNYSPTKSHAFNAIINRMLQAKLNYLDYFEIWGTGKPVREWIYINDLCRIILNTLKNLKVLKNSTLNVPGGVCLSIRDLAYKIKKELNYSGKIKFNKNYKDGSLKKVMKIKKFNKCFKEFKLTPLKESLKKTVDYYFSVKPK